MRRLIIALVLAGVASVACTWAQAEAQAIEPDQTYYVGQCTAVLEVHYLARIGQMDRATGDGLYAIPMLAQAGTVVVIRPRYQDTIILVWADGLFPTTLRELRCPGAPGWRVYLPAAVHD